MDKKKTILDYIRDEFLDDDIEIDENTSLFRQNTLDSMSLSSLIVFIEQNFGVKVKPLDIVFENFDTVNKMISFIENNQ